METLNNTEEICFDLSDASIHGLAQGADESDIVLCLHGWLDNANSFLPMMPYFKNKRVIAIDWPGHGFSSHRSMDAHYHFIDWVYDLAKLFDINQWQSVDIVGHSMGGMIATAFAAAYPEKVKTLTLIDSIGFVSSDVESTTEQLRKGLASRLKGQNKLKTAHPSFESAVKARVAVSDLAFEQAALIVKRGLVKQGDTYTWRSDSRLRYTSPYRLTLEQAKQLIKDVQCPVNLIYGTKGLDAVQAGIKEFSPLFQQFELQEFAGGHHLHMEYPEQVALLINEFLLDK